MSADHVAIVWNPAKVSRDDLEAAMPDGVAPSWIETSPDDSREDFVRGIREADPGVVVAAGGDGTVRAVAEALADGAVEADLGIVPCGTGNLLARNLDIPVNNVSEALERAVNGSPNPIDIGRMSLSGGGQESEHIFLVMAGFGIDANMIAETDDDLKDKAGWLAYVESLGRAVSASEVVELTLQVDGAKPETTRAHTLLVGNCGTMPGGLVLLPGADPSDGELDLMLLSAEGIGGWLDTVRNMMWDNGLKRVFSNEERATSSESMSHARLQHLTVDLPDARVIEVDGDEVGDATRLKVTVQPGAIRVRS